LNVLEINKLDKSYGSVHAVNHLSLKVSEGQVYGILGPNGSGKTTTLSMILGIIRPDSGQYQWFEKKATPRIHRKIGTLIETPNFYPYLTLVRNLKLVCRIKDISFDDVARVLKIVDLWDRRNSRFETLSYGMKQRLILASVLLGDPEVLVLDEPANGLDPEGIAEVRGIIRDEAQKGKTILLASHILDEVEKVCSHVAILKKGKLLAAGEVGALLKGEKLLFIASPDPDKLEEFLSSHNMVEKFTRERNEFRVNLKPETDITMVSRDLLGKGIVISRMEEKKQTLEEQFLELVSKKEEL
jgi:ABC-2 type transport system ATP-binding protein